MGGFNGDANDGGQSPTNIQIPPELTLRDPDEVGLWQMDDQAALELGLKVLQAEAASFGKRFIQDSKVRRDYQIAVKKFSDEALAAVARGEITAQDAMLSTHAMRNELMELSRLKSSDIGRAQAEAMKSTGVKLETLMEKYAQKHYNKPFAELAEAERGNVYLKIVESSGRANPKVSLRAARLAKVGKAFWVFTAAVAIYNIATPDDKVVATVREGVSVGGGMVGGALAGAAAGGLCGPGAPVCVTIGVFVGGALGAIGADALFDSLLETGRKLQDDFWRVMNPGFSFPGKPTSCFAPWTPVLGTAGPCPIATIRPGDWVLGYDHATMRAGRTRVVAVDVHPGEFDLLTLHVAGSEPLSVTAGHWFWTGDDWVLSEDLARHGRILSVSGTPVSAALTGPEHSRALRVYNVRTECGTYLVGGPGLVVSGVVVSQLDAGHAGHEASVALAARLSEAG